MKIIKHYVKEFPEDDWHYTSTIYCETEEIYLDMCKRLEITPDVTTIGDLDKYETEQEIITIGIIFKYQLSYVYSIN